MKRKTAEAIIGLLKLKKTHWGLILIGLPGSGKSTFRQQVVDALDYPVAIASTDDMIDEYAAKHGITYSQAFDKVNQKHLKAEMQRIITEAADAGVPVIIDQTNMGEKARRGKLATLFNRQYNVSALTFEVPMPELKARLAKREAATGKHIPEFVLKQMLGSYNSPSKSEGFEYIWELEQRVTVDNHRSTIG